MKLLQVVPTYVPAYRHGGPIFAVHGLCKALAARGHQVSVFTTDVDGDGTLDVPLAQPVELDGVEVWYFPVRFGRRIYWAPSMKRALARRLPATDLVHLQSVFLWPTSAAARAAERRRIPYVVSPRGMLVPELLRRRGRLRKALWLRWVERRTLARAAAVHCTSDLELAEAQATGLALPRAIVVANGVDAAERFDPREVSEPVRAALARRPLLFFLGRLSWKKGIDRLVAMLPLLPEATLALAGPDEDGLRPRLETMAREAGAAGRLLFLGSVGGADKAALLRGCDVFLLPSLSENFGNVVLEAMAAERPVIVTPGVGLAPELARTETGVVAEGNAEAFARACSELLGDPERAQGMGERAARHVAEHFTWPAIAAQMEMQYQEIVDRSGRPGAVA